MTSLEQVEKLCAMANISYEEAKAVLEAANGDMLDAVIALEKQGKIHAPSGGGYYTSQQVADAEPEENRENRQTDQKSASHGTTFTSFMKDIGRTCLKLIRKGNVNSFEVLRQNEIKASMPITVLALLLIFAFWVTIPLVIIGLFFGFRFRFSGPDFQQNNINKVMDNAAEAAEDLKKSIKVN